MAIIYIGRKNCCKCIYDGERKSRGEYEITFIYEGIIIGVI